MVISWHRPTYAQALGRQTQNNVNNCCWQTGDYSWPAQWKGESLLSASLARKNSDGSFTQYWIKNNRRSLSRSNLSLQSNDQICRCCVTKGPHTHASYKCSTSVINSKEMGERISTKHRRSFRRRLWFFTSQHWFFTPRPWFFTSGTWFFHSSAFIVHSSALVFTRQP